MNSFVRDIRLALRHLARERAFGVVVVLTLGVCIGANVAAFSVLNAVVLQPLPYPAADRIVTILFHRVAPPWSAVILQQPPLHDCFRGSRTRVYIAIAYPSSLNYISLVHHQGSR